MLHVKKQKIIDLYCDFYKLNGRHPTKTNSLEEKRLCVWRYNNIYINNLTDKQSKQLLSIDPLFFTKHIKNI
jgi:hypothetical protein